MPERPTQNEVFVKDLNQAIQSEWQKFSELSHLHSVQEFCRYDSRYSTISNPEEGIPNLDFMTRKVKIESFDENGVADCLVRTNERVSDFLDNITSVYCVRKRISLPEDIPQKQQILAKIMSGGISKVHKYMRWSNIEHEDIDNIYDYYQLSFLPATLLTLGARLKAGEWYDSTDGSLEANASQEEIDQNIDQALQEVCKTIQQGKKLNCPKNASDGEKAFTSSMNCLRSIYSLHQDEGLKKQILIFYGSIFTRQEMAKYNDPYSHTLEIGDKAYKNFSNFFKDLINAKFSSLDPTRATIILEKARNLDLEKYGENLENEEKFLKDLSELESRISSTHAAQRLVDAVASGEIRYSEVLKTTMQLYKQPLKIDRPLLEELVLDEWVSWEILPPGLLEEMESHASNTETNQEPYSHERQTDWKRLWRLQNYAKGWQGAYFARTTIPNLPNDKQYYAVIMPEEKDGMIIEHAVADHPETGNGMYVWRAEVGIEDRRTKLSWREVMSQPRMVARKLGARCLYHTENLEANLMEYLTLPAELAKRQRYSRRSLR